MSPTTTRTAPEVIAFPASVTADEPKHPVGYEGSRLNALKHGILSKHVVLGHECWDEFGALLSALVVEHQPSGPTETHLVEELAGVIWRKRRVLQAEGASINRGLLVVSKARHDRPIDPDGPASAALPFEPAMANSRLNSPAELAEAIREGATDTQARQTEAEEDLAATLRAEAILQRGGVRAYDRALRALTPSSADWWNDLLGEEEATADAESLAQFVSGDLMRYCRNAVVEAQSHEAIKAQTLGEGVQAHRLEKLNRYETHLDRKFERALAMLLKLKDLRRGA